ncbi:MAG TPA: choice-of-anchor Q domain-containing protein [Polyangiaceae bacterium]|nr:choice-of-anchor Q domain-containing protein [Polyangiaceae bacterium]
MTDSPRTVTRSRMRMLRPQCSRVALLGALLIASSCEPAANIAVTTPLDQGNGSLRAAITRANALDSRENTAIHIQLASGTYELTRCAADDSNAAGDLDLTTDVPVVLIGGGPGVVIRQTCPGERVIDSLGDGSLTLRGVTVTGGSLLGSDPSLSLVGGGVRAQGDVILEGAIITGNTIKAAAGSAAVAGGAAARGGIARGAGVYVGGSLFGTDAIVSSNILTSGDGANRAAEDGAGAEGGDAEGGGAFVAGNIVLVRGAFTGNEARGGFAARARGGGLAQETTSTAKASISSTSFSRNSAVAGATLAGNLTRTADASGGAVAISGELELISVTAVENSAIAGSGTLAEHIVQTAPSPIIERIVTAAPGVARGGALATAGPASLLNATFTKNSSVGGGMRENCTVFAPQVPSTPMCQFAPSPPGGAAEGAAVWGGASLTIEGGAYSQQVNEAGRGSKQIVFPGGRPRTGYSRGPAGPTLRAATDVQIQGGEYVANVGGAYGGSVDEGPPGNMPAEVVGAAQGSIVGANFRNNGGGITVAGALTVRDTRMLSSGGIVAASVDAERLTIANTGRSVSATGHVSLVNTTLTNTSYGVSAGSLELRHATIVDVSYSGGAPAFDTAELTSHASVVSVSEGNSACAAGVIVQSSAHNWFSEASCGLAGIGDRQTRAEFLLQPFAETGAGLPTRAPGPGSVLIDAVPAAACSLERDALGVERPQGAGCDIGAVEVVPVPGTGPSNLALQFTPRASAPGGELSTWELALENRGPNATTASVVLNTPEFVTMWGAAASHGGVCTFSSALMVTCIWHTPLAVAARAIVTIEARPAAFFEPVPRTLTARVYAPQPLPPLEDDAASVTTLVMPEPR